MSNHDALWARLLVKKLGRFEPMVKEKFMVYIDNLCIQIGCNTWTPPTLEPGQQVYVPAQPPPPPPPQPPPQQPPAPPSKRGKRSTKKSSDVAGASLASTSQQHLNQPQSQCPSQGYMADGLAPGTPQQQSRQFTNVSQVYPNSASIIYAIESPNRAFMPGVGYQTAVPVSVGGQMNTQQAGTSNVYQQLHTVNTMPYQAPNIINIPGVANVRHQLNYNSSP